MNEPIQYLDSLFESDENALKFLDTFNDFCPAIVFIYDVSQKNIRFLNSKITDVLGFTVADINKSEDALAKLVYHDDLAKVEAEFKKILYLEDNKSHTFVAKLNHSNNAWRLFRTVGRVFKRDVAHNPLSLICIAEDITTQLLTEKEVIATRQLFDETEKLLLFGTWSWRLSPDEVEWTAGMYEILEYDKGECGVIDHSFYTRHISPEHIENFMATSQKAIVDKCNFEIEYVLKTKNDNEKYVYTKGKPILDRDGNVSMLIGITRDITTKKNLEKHRERIIRELNRSNKELEEFAYVASHDLHEPLRKILTFSERVKTKYGEALGDEGKVYLDRISGSAESMRALINNLLEFSKITQGSRSFETCDLSDVIQKVITDQELRIEETGTTIKIKSLPVIEAVPAEMRQLFNNLFSNSLKFCLKDKAPVLMLSCRKLTYADKSEHALPFDQVYYQINIKDNGIGFDSKYGDKIFEIFQRLHGKAEYAGSGIGLAICKKIVDNHDGIIYAKSKPGGGSVFSIILPERKFR